MASMTKLIVMLIDASASVTVLASEAPKSQSTQLFWEAISGRPEYQKLKKRLGAVHTFGPANLMANAASKDKRDVIDRISTQMCLAAVQLRVSRSLKESITKKFQKILFLMNKEVADQGAAADLGTNPGIAMQSAPLIGGNHTASADEAAGSQLGDEQMNL